MGILLGLSLTQLLELPFFLLLKRKSASELIGWALLNVFTNVTMNLLYSHAFHYSGAFLLLAELLVFIIEPSALFLLDGRSAEGIFAGVMGNAASLTIGMLLSSSLARANADMMVVLIVVMAALLIEVAGLAAPLLLKARKKAPR